jgi:hypothetical protein
VLNRKQREQLEARYQALNPAALWRQIQGLRDRLFDLVEAKGQAAFGSSPGARPPRELYPLYAKEENVGAFGHFLAWLNNPRFGHLLNWLDRSSGASNLPCPINAFAGCHPTPPRCIAYSC